MTTDPKLWLTKAAHGRDGTMDAQACLIEAELELRKWGQHRAAGIARTALIVGDDPKVAAQRALDELEGRGDGTA